MSGRHFVVQTPAIAPLPRTGAEDSDPYQKQDTTEAGALRRTADTRYAAQGFDAVTVEEGTKNFVTNPQAGSGDTTGWTVFGANTHEQVTFDAEGVTLDGLPDGVTTGIKITYQNHIALVTAVILLTAAAYKGSMYFYIPSGWSGAGIDFLQNGFAGSSGETTDPLDMSLRDQWQRMTTGPITPVAGDLSGNALNATASGAAPAAGDFIYVTAGLVEQKDYATSYCDGSLGIGYSWDGTAHASTSQRSVGTVELDNSDGLLDATLGGFVANFRALKDSTDPGDGYLMVRRQDAANLMAVYYDQPGGRFVLQSRVAGVDDEAAVVAAFSRGDDIFIHPGWTDGVLRLRVRVSSGISGIDYDSGRVARAQGVPTITNTTIDVGSDDSGALQPNINLDYFVTLTRPLTDAEMRDYQTLVRPPWAGQVTGAPIVTACLRGEDEAA